MSKEERLENRLGLLSEVIVSGEQWLRAHRPGKSAQDIELFGRFAARHRALERAHTGRPAVGLFGESQVGKSFLVTALLRGQGDFRVRIHPEAEEVAFQTLNPRKETEATAVATRFGIDGRNEAGRDFYKVSLLTAGTLMRCMFEGFMLEVAPQDRERCYDEVGGLEDRIAAVKANTGSTLTKRGSADFQDSYLAVKSAYFNDEVRPSAEPVDKVLQLLRAHGAELTAETAVAAASVLWWGYDGLTDLYDHLLRTFASWGEPEAVYLPAPTLPSILDTEYLLHYQGEEQRERLYVRKDRSLSGGEAIAFQKATASDGTDISVLQLFAREIYLQAASESSPLLERMDVIDFPGMKPYRDSDTAWRREDFERTGPRLVVHLTKMGKLRYLFRQATADHELPLLLFCVPPNNPKTPQLTKNVEEWLESFGEEGEEAKGAALFTVMTKSDELLKEQADEDLALERWKVRFTTNFEDEHKWVGELGGYSNVFLIRNTASNLYSLPTDLTSYESAFFQSPDVERYLNGRRRAVWDALTGEYGGVRLLHEALLDAAAAAPERWRSYLARKVDALVGEVHGALSHYYVPEDEAERVREQKEAAKRFLEQVGAHPHKNLPYLLRSLVDAFPGAAWAREYEAEEADSFLPRAPLDDALDFWVALIEAYRANLQAGVHRLAENTIEDVDAETLARYVRTMTAYLRQDSSLTEQYLRKNQTAFGNFGPAERLLIREGLLLIQMQQLTYLGHPPSLNDVDPCRPLDRYLPHDVLMEHWTQHLPSVYDSAVPQHDLRGNEEVGRMLQSPLFVDSNP